jgi:nitrate reductase gamma subunit
MLALMDWAKHLVLLQSDAPLYMLAVPAIYKLHMVVGMTLFVIFPFTRLVHAFSGFAAVGYVARSWQLVRRK